MILDGIGKPGTPSLALKVTREGVSSYAFYQELRSNNLVEERALAQKLAMCPFLQPLVCAMYDLRVLVFPFYPQDLHKFLQSTRLQSFTRRGPLCTEMRAPLLCPPRCDAPR